MSVPTPDIDDLTQYDKQGWVDVPTGTTPPPGAVTMSSTSLLHMEDGIGRARLVAIAAWTALQALEDLIAQLPAGGDLVTSTALSTSLQELRNDLAAVARSGSYADLIGRPTIPSQPSDIGAQPAGAYARLESGVVPDAQLPSRLAAAAVASAISTAVAAEHNLLVGDSPAALDTIRELAAALGDDPNKITTLTAAIAAKYTKPAGGIPATDLAVGVVPDTSTLLTKTDAAATYQQKQLTRALGRLYGGLAARTTLPCRLAFTGSSTTAGTAATTAAKRYVNLLVGYLQGAYPSGTGSETSVIASGAGSWGTLSNAPGVHGYNAGKGGTTAATYLDSTATAAVIALNPRMVLHMVGSNDFKNRVPVATYKSTVAAKIAELKAGITGPCVHLLVQPYERFDSGFTPLAPWADYGRALAEIAAADPDNVAYLDISGPYYPVGVPGSDPLDLIDTDSVHQTDAGHAFMADLLRQALTLPQITTVAVADTVAPTVPANLSATSGNAQVALTWSASTDNVAVTGYRIRRDGSALTTVTGTSYTDTGLTNGTSYSYTVAAYDAAGNESAQSTAATGLPAAASDTQAPTVPGTPTATAGANSATATTTGSTDNVGVTGYRWYRGGNQVGSTSGTSFTETGLPAGTPVSYTVAAIDAAGNLSAQSAASNAVTPTAAVSNLALDSFTDTNGKLLFQHTGETNATWTRHPSATTDYMEIASNRIFQNTTGSTQRHRTPAVGTADYTAEMDIVCLSQQTGGSFGIFARLNNAAARSAYYVQYQPATGAWTLSKVVSDTTSTLGNAFVQKLNAGQVGRATVTCKGSTISGTVTIDGVTTDLGTATDTSIPDAGTPGLFSAASSQTSTTGHHLDNYRVVAA